MECTHDVIGEIARAEATRVVEAAYRKAVAAGELPEGTFLNLRQRPQRITSNGDLGITPLPCSAQSVAYGAAQDRGEYRSQPRPEGSCF